MPTDTEQRALTELTAWTLSLRDAPFIHQHVVDAWAAQHADEHSKPIGIAFALIGLYLHLERGFSGREVQRAHMQLAQPHGRGKARKDWPRFPLPEDRGALTAAHVIAAPAAQRAQAIDAWCRSVWDAWKDSHAAVAVWAERDLHLKSARTK